MTVTAASPQASGMLSNIQEGINSITAGGTLNILTGTYAGNVDINKVLTLRGTPTISGTLTASVAGATISPGFSPGIINSGNLSLTAGSNVDIELNGSTVGTGYDQINVTGTVSLGGATLNVSTGYTPSVGTIFTIVNNDAADAVTGTFATLPEATVFYIGSNAFRISYIGGTGNDVTLTSVSLCNAVTVPNVSTPTGVPITVPINVDSVTGNGILSYDFTLNYNQAVVTFINVNSTGTISDGRSVTVNSATPGTLKVSVFGTLPMTGAGVLLNLNFNVIGGIGANTGLNFAGFMFNEGTPCLSVTNGSVTVISGTISGSVTYLQTGGPIPNATLSGTGSVNVSTTTNVSGAYSLSGFGAGAYTVTPSKIGGFDLIDISAFDSAAIAQHVVGISTLTANQQLAADVSNNGTITSFDAALIARFVVALPNTGVTGTWRFQPASRNYASVAASLTGENYTSVLMGDVSGNWTPFAPPLTELSSDELAKALSVSIPTDLVVPNGVDFTVPVLVEDTTGLGIVAYQFELNYDPKVIEPLENPCAVAETLSSSLTATCNAVEPGLLKVAVFGALPINGKGTVINLRFNAIGKDGKESSLAFRQFMFNEGLLQHRTTDGRITIGQKTEETAEVSGRLLTGKRGVIAGARITMIDGKGISRSTTTNELGNYQFDNVPVGESYQVQISAEGYTFPMQYLTVATELREVNFTAEP